MAGALGAAAGLLILARALGRLRRAGVFTGLFWASARVYPGYRARSLGPALSAVLGLGLTAAGGFGVYLGLTGYWARSLLFR